jgi:hypothetical protein
VLDSVRYRIDENKRKGFVAGYDANFTTAFSTKLYFDYFYRKGKVKQIRHLMIPTLAYTYRPDFGEDKYGFWKKVPLDTLNRTRSYSIFEKGIYGGPGPGEQRSVSLGLNNNIEAKVKQKTDTGITFKKVVVLQNLGLTSAYNFAADSLKWSPLGITARTVLFKYFDLNAYSSFNPYVYNKDEARIRDQYTFNNDGRIARFTNASLAVSTSISNNLVEDLKKIRKPPSMTNGAERGAENVLNPNENLPWHVSITYRLDLNNPDDTKIHPVHNLNFAGEVLPTKFWKIGITSGFDFTAQKLSYTSLSIHRDLKCWEAQIDWVPFGIRKSYRVQINLKTSMLSSFKIPRQSPPRLENY